MMSQRILSNQYFKQIRSTYDNSTTTNNHGQHVTMEDLETHSKLSRNFSKQLFSYLDTVEKFLIINVIDNIHVWKFFIKVFYFSSKLDKDI